MVLLAFLGFLVAVVVLSLLLSAWILWVIDRWESRAETREQLRDSYYD